MNNNGCIIPEIDEQNIGVQQENATFLVIGDEAYTSEIIEEYNRNAAAKTEEFNTNATNKTNDFNTNYDNKIKAFNSNAVTKTEDFDSHVTAQTTNFNNNAETATTNFNRNAIQQTDEFNRNAMSYSQGIEENKKNIASTSNELYHLKTDILETGESSGNNIHLEDSAWAEMQEIKVDGILSQETTNGYQLFDVSKVTTIHNGTIENEIVTSNALNGNGQGVTYNFPSITLDANTTYYIFADIRIKSGTGSVNDINNGVVGWEKVSFPSLSNNYNTFISKYTPTENENIYAVYFGFNNANNLIINIQNVMITTDRNATYEKYTGNQPSPNPDYPQEIKTITDNLSVTSCNKNVFKITSALKHIVILGIDITIDNNVITLNGTSTGSMWPDFIWGIQSNTFIHNKCKYYFSEQLEDYTATINILSGTATGGSFIITANDDGSSTFSFNLKNLQGSITRKANGINRAYLSDITKGTKFDNFTFEIMLEKGSVATAFERRVENQIQAKLPENEFFGKLDDTYKDTLRTEYFPEEGQYHLMLDKKVGKYVFTGDENFTIMNPSSGIAQIRYLNSKIAKLSDSNYVRAISNYFTHNYVWGNSWSKDNSVAHWVGFSAIVFYSSNFSTVSDFEQFLKDKYDNGNPVVVYYLLAKPYTIDLGPIDMPLTYDEITNIFTDSDLLPTINVKYYRNFTATIQNLQVNNDTLKNELSNIESRLTALESANTNIESRLATLENANKNVADSNPTEESEVTE